MKSPGLENGFFMKPIVLEGLDVDSEAYFEDFFGPVFSLYRVHGL